MIVPPWLLKESSGPPRRCSPILLEECEVLRRPDTAEREGIEVVHAVCGAAGQRLLRCPACSRACRSLHSSPETGWLCRRCGGWDYLSRHTWDTGHFRLAARLRRQLGSDPAPGAELPPRPKTAARARKYDRLVRRIRHHELRGIVAGQRFIDATLRLVRECDR